MNIVEETQARALQPLTDRRQVVEKEAENIIQDLNKEITLFKTTISKLEEIAALEDHILFLQVRENVETPPQALDPEGCCFYFFLMLC